MEIGQEACLGKYVADEVHRMPIDNRVFMDIYLDGNSAARCSGPGDFRRQGVGGIRPSRKTPEICATIDVLMLNTPAMV